MMSAIEGQPFDPTKAETLDTEWTARWDWLELQFVAHRTIYGRFHVECPLTYQLIEHYGRFPEYKQIGWFGIERKLAELNGND